MGQKSQATRKRRIALFNAWADMHAVLGDDHPGLPVSRITAGEAARRAQAVYGVHVSLLDATRWLADAAKYTPFIDDVAVRKAVDFHRGAFDALSDDERDAFYARLAVIENAYDDPQRMFSGMGKVRNRGIPTPDQKTERRLRWEQDWSRAQRRKVQHHVSYLRKFIEEDQ